VDLFTRPANGQDSAVSAIVELRQYTLHPGRRDDLIDLFDAHLVEPQEQDGMQVIGQFRDLDDADRFVWLRGFPDMAERARSLAAFYGGPVWKKHREAANATMVDSDDVLLLRPALPDSGFALGREHNGGGGFVLACVLREAQEIAPSIEANGGAVLGYFESETSENTFPSLPVREGEHVFVWFAGFSDRDELERAASEHVDHAQQVLRLAPTSRSLLHGTNRKEA
jgi:hypothetical protein